MAEQQSMELEYLKSDKVGKILVQGLAHLYEVQPKFPIDYLAKWLLNHSATLQNEQKLGEKQAFQNSLKEAHGQDLERIAQVEKKAGEDKQSDLQVDEDFRTTIKEHEYHNELIIDQFPDFLEKRKGLTGCYIGYKDFSVRDINDEEEDTRAHLNVDEAEVINYIGYSESQQQLMANKILKVEGSVTGKVFDPKEEPQVDPENPDDVPEPQPDYVYVPDVVKNTGVHYFRLPKLGAYLAIPLFFESCLSEKAFDEGLRSREECIAQIELNKQERQKIQEEYETTVQGLKDEGQDPAEEIEKFEAQLKEIVDPVEPEYQTDPRKYVVCCDSLGQDKEISKEDIEWLNNFTQLFAESWKQKETSLLSADIDRQIEYKEKLPQKYDEMVQAYQEQEEQYSLEKEQEFAELQNTDPLQYNFRLTYCRLEKVKEQLMQQQNQDLFLLLKEYRVIKFPGIIQNILYLLGHTREEINTKGTHILNWKLVSKKLINEQFFEKVLNYNLKGEKRDEVPPYTLVNKIGKKVEGYDMEEVNAYNVTFGRLLQWLRYTCELRKKDIQIRRNQIQQEKIRIEQITTQNQELDEKFQLDLAEEEEKYKDNEEEPFNKEAWVAEFWEKNEKKVVPDDVEDQIDNDCIVDEE